MRRGSLPEVSPRYAVERLLPAPLSRHATGTPTREYHVMRRSAFTPASPPSLSPPALLWHQLKAPPPLHMTYLARQSVVDEAPGHQWGGGGEARRMLPG